MSIITKANKTATASGNATSRKATTRNATVDFLRIIAILMVITLHYLGVDADSVLEQRIAGFNLDAAYVLKALAIIGVNIFILISGFCGVTSEGLNLRRGLNIIIITSFWSTCCYLFTVGTGAAEFTIVELLKNIFAVIFIKIWFIRSYLVLFIIAPFLNIALKKLAKKDYIILIGALTIFLSILPSFCEAWHGSRGYDALHFIYIYIIGGYIRLHVTFAKKRVTPLLIYILCAALTCVFSYIMSDREIAWGYNFIFNVVGSVAFFMFFMQFNMKGKAFTVIGKATLGVYLINVLIPNIYILTNRADYVNSEYMLLHYAVFTLGFFTVATLLEIVRSFIFKQFR